MIYSFITDHDLDVALKEYFREQITVQEDRKHIQVTSEGAAFSMIKSKLNSRYDIALLFPEITEWNAATAFTTGKYCAKDDLVYQAISDGTNHEPDEQDSTYWKQKDPRDQMLVVYCAVLTAYNMMRSINPRKIPQSLHDEYVSIMDWLDDVKTGVESPAWPLLENGSSTIQWGSEPQIEHYY